MLINIVIGLLFIVGSSLLFAEILHVAYVFEYSGLFGFVLCFLGLMLLSIRSRKRHNNMKDGGRIGSPVDDGGGSGFKSGRKSNDSSDSDSGGFDGGGFGGGGD